MPKLAAAGPVSKLRLLGDYHHTTRIAFVEFNNAESARAALNCSGALLGKSTVLLNVLAASVLLQALVTQPGLCNQQIPSQHSYSYLPSDRTVFVLHRAGFSCSLAPMAHILYIQGPHQCAYPHPRHL